MSDLKIDIKELKKLNLDSNSEDFFLKKKLWEESSNKDYFFSQTELVSIVEKNSILIRVVNEKQKNFLFKNYDLNVNQLFCERIFGRKKNIMIINKEELQKNEGFAFILFKDELGVKNFINNLVDGLISQKK